MKWISVKDKYPIDSEHTCSQDAVLVLAKNCYPYGFDLHSIAEYIDNKWVILGEQGSFDCSGFYPIKSENIAHWMPLPEKPEIGD